MKGGGGGGGGRLLASVCPLVLGMARSGVGDLGGVCIVVLQVLSLIFVWLWHHGRGPTGQ